MALVVTTTWLEMTHPTQLRPARNVRGASAERVHDAEVNRRMYLGVGGPHQWTERLGWDDRQWARLAARVETWLARLDGEPAGFAELDLRSDGEVKILYFGLLARFQGVGLGGWFLTEVLRRAWEAHPDGTRRVWLHTCSLDGPYALANYEARGLRPFRRERTPRAA